MESQGQIRQNIGCNLLNLRHMRGLTQKQLSQKIGVPVSTICVIESGFGNPSAVLLSQFSRFYGVEMNEIVKRPRVDFYIVLHKQKVSTRILNTGVQIQEFTSKDSRLKYKSLLLPPRTSVQMPPALARTTEILACQEGEFWIHGPKERRLVRIHESIECESHHRKKIDNIENKVCRLTLIRIAEF